MKTNFGTIILILGILSFFLPFVGLFTANVWFDNTVQIMIWIDKNISPDLGLIFSALPFSGPAFLGIVTGIWGIIYCIIVQPKQSKKFFPALTGMIFGFGSIWSSLIFFVISLASMIGDNF